MTERLVWPKVLRPPVPLVYLDLNSIIYIARTMRGDVGVPAGYNALFEAAQRAKNDKRAMFPIGEGHLWEISKITDPKQRASLADVLETLSNFNYLLPRTTIAELEFDAGIADILGEEPRFSGIRLIRPTIAQLFQNLDGSSLLETRGLDRLHAEISSAEDPQRMRELTLQSREYERLMLRGPSDADKEVLRRDPNYQPQRAIATHQSRVEWELDTERVLNEAPRWRRGRLRDVVGAREVVHEWTDLFTRLRRERLRAGLQSFEPSEDAFRRFLGSMPHTQVSISLKTRLHSNPQHKWTPNDISDIDAISVAFAYCEVVFPDKAMRRMLQSSNELRGIPTFIPRRPQEITEWLDALPAVPDTNQLVSHPLLGKSETG